MIKPHKDASSGGRKSLLGAIVCIALSLVPLIVVLTVADGMIEGITARLIGLSSYHLRVYPPPDASADAASLAEYAESLARREGVTGAFPEQQGIALAAGKDGRIGVTVRAVTQDLFAHNGDFAALLTVLEGGMDLWTESRAAGALIGSKAASELGVHAGDTLRIITLRTSASGVPLPRSSTFTVMGVVSSGYQELDALWVFIPLEEGARILPPASSQSFVGLSTANPFSRGFNLVRRDIERSLPPGASLYTWSEFNSAQFENFSSTKTMLMFIMFLIVMVASVNISSALIILAIERRREIAILKSLGAASGGISFSFLLTGFYAGLCGVVLGVPPGILCALNVNEIISFMEKVVNIAVKLVYSIGSPYGSADFLPVHLLDPAYYLEKIPVILPFAQLTAIVCGTLFLSVLVSVGPSIKAGREKPIHTLRKH